MTQNKTAGGAIPRLAMLNDIAGVGRCSTTVSLPVISALGVQVCPIPTAVLSNHLGFSKCHTVDLTEEIHDYLAAWEALDFTFEGLYCGYLSNPTQVNAVTSFLENFHPEFFLLDPVMADHGKFYSGMDMNHCERLRPLLSRATIITPNLTEACLLTDTPWHEGAWEEEEIRSLCLALRKLCAGDIVITGLRRPSTEGNAPETLVNVICRKKNISETPCNEISYLDVPALYPSRPGTGDLFASILAAELLKGNTLEAAVKKAADFISLCVAESHKAGIPVSFGVQFEPLLPKLL